MRSISLFVCAMLPLIVLAQGGISVSPSKVNFYGNPNDKVSQEITVINPSNTPIDLITYFADWERDSFGTKVYHDPGTLVGSCYSWLQYAAQSVHLEPGERKTIRIFMKIPEDPTESSEIKNSMLFLKQNRPSASVEDDDQHLQSGMDVYFQVGVHIYYTPASVNRKELEIRNLEKTHPDHLRIALENTGNLQVEANIKLELTHKETGEEFIIFKDPKRVSFLPGDFRYVRMAIPDDLPIGPYSALTIVDIDPHLDLQIGMLDFDL